MTCSIQEEFISSLPYRLVYSTKSQMIFYIGKYLKSVSLILLCFIEKNSIVFFSYSFLNYRKIYVHIFEQREKERKIEMYSFGRFKFIYAPTHMYTYRHTQSDHQSTKPMCFTIYLCYIRKKGSGYIRILVYLLVICS